VKPDVNVLQVSIVTLLDIVFLMINVHHQNQDHAEPTNILTGVEINALKVNVAVFNPMAIIVLLTREALLVHPSVSRDVNVKLDLFVMTKQEAQHLENVLPLMRVSKYQQRRQWL